MKITNQTSRAIFCEFSCMQNIYDIDVEIHLRQQNNFKPTF